MYTENQVFKKITRRKQFNGAFLAGTIYLKLNPLTGKGAFK